MIIHTGFPKSGTTWLETMVAQLAGVKRINIHGAPRWPEEQLRRFLDEHHAQPVSARDHFFPQTYPLFASYGIPVIFIYRHPADIVTSLHHHRVRKGQCTMEEFSATLDHFEKVQSKVAWRHQEGVFVTRYEDLMRNTVAVLSDVGRYLGCEFEPESISQVVDQCSFEKMWGRERGKEHLDSHGRKGIIGDHLNFLTGERAKQWEGRFPGIAADWGYGSDYAPESTPHDSAPPIPIPQWRLALRRWKSGLIRPARPQSRRSA